LQRLFIRSPSLAAFDGDAAADEKEAQVGAMRPLLDGSVRLMLQEAGRGFSLDVDGGGFLVGFELFSLTLFGFDGGVFLTFETQPTGFATDGGDRADVGCWWCVD
jgi:hypothetical protein